MPGLCREPTEEEEVEEEENQKQRRDRDFTWRLSGHVVFFKGTLMASLSLKVTSFLLPFKFCSQILDPMKERRQQESGKEGDGIRGSHSPVRQQLPLLFNSLRRFPGHAAEKHLHPVRPRSSDIL